MQIDLTGHHVDITTPLRDYVNSKMERLERHFEHVNDIHVILSVEKLRRSVLEVVIVRRQEVGEDRRTVDSFPEKSVMRKNVRFVPGDLLGHEDIDAALFQYLRQSRGVPEDIG